LLSKTYMNKYNGKKIFKIIEWGVSALLLGLVLIVAFSYLPNKKIFSAYAIVTGSMEPTVHVGALTFVQKTNPKELHKGDIIAFTVPSEPKMVILHRIYSIEQVASSQVFITKGDHNPIPDKWQVMPSQIRGKFVFTLPYIGYLIVFLKTPIGFGILIGLPVLLLIILNVLKIKEGIHEEIEKGIAKKEKQIGLSSSNDLMLLPTIFLFILVLISTPLIFGLTFNSVTIGKFSITYPLPTPLTVSSVTVSSNPVKINYPTNVSAKFNDYITETHMAIWNWGDGTTTPAFVTESNGSGSISGNHIYSVTGVYSVSLAVTNKDNITVTQNYGYVVVYDANGGFVTGGGTIISPLGAYVVEPSLSGKANFGFVSKYLKGANIPSGSTQFHFNTAKFDFASTSYDWLVISGSKAQYKGSGTINGTGDYGFKLTAIDGQINGGGGVDKFRIKIIDKITGNIVYDNQQNADDSTAPTTVIESGSIIIHQ
jgi:signal peptidase I